MATGLLITGASGLIGSRTVPLLKQDGVPLVTLEDAVAGRDLLAPGAPRGILDEVRPSAVLHLAWVASGTPGYRKHPDNRAWAAASLELARLCRARGIWFIGTGTVAELTPTPTDDYTAAKKTLFDSLRPLADDHQLTWLRPHYVFDPEAGRPEVMAEIRRATLDGRSPRLLEPGAQHDFIHSQDVGQAIRTVVSSRIRGLCPIGYGSTHTVAQLARAFGATDVADSPPTTEREHFTADTSTLAAAGWFPRATKEYFHE